MAGPIVARLDSGAEYGFVDAATALKLYPAAEIVRYQDGTPFEADGDEPAVNFADMTRDELDAYAGKVGVEGASDLPNKAAVIAAIEDAT